MPFSTDEELIRFEDEVKKATVKVRFTSNPAKEREYSTGTVIGHTGSKTIILTVAHLLRLVSNPMSHANLLEVVFYGSDIPFQSSIALVVESAEILLLVVDQPNQPPTKMLFAPEEEWVLRHFQSLFCFSHPLGREWRCGSGRVREPEVRNDSGIYDKRMIFFDHDLALVSGSSGAGIVNEYGHIVGIQSGEILHTVPVISGNPLLKALAARSSKEEDLSISLADLQLRRRDVDMIRISPCNIKQAVHIKYLDAAIRENISLDEDKQLSLNELIETYVHNKFYPSKSASSSS